MDSSVDVIAGAKVVTPEKRTNVRWKIFFLMLCLVSINYIDRASLSIAMPLISQEFNLNAMEQGLILSSFFWTYTIMQVPGGLLADRFKPRIMIAAATFGWGFFQAIAAVSTGWFTLTLTRLGLGAAEAPIYPAGGKLNAMWMTRHERGRGATLLDGGSSLGSALGAIIIAWLIAVLSSWRLAFLVAGIGTILCGFWAWYYIRNHPREHPHANEAEARYLEEEHAREDAESPPSAGGNVLGFFRHRSVWSMCLGFMCVNSVFYGLLTWMPIYLYKEHGFDIKALGGATFVIFFAGFVGELIGGQIADHWRARGGSSDLVFRTLFGIAAVVATVSIFSVAYIKGPVAVVVLLSTTLFFLRWCGLYWAVPAVLATRDRVGFLAGSMNVAGNIAGILVPVIVGFIVQMTGSYFLALMFFAALGICIFIFSMLIRYERLPV